jgi:hypothetical protein
MNRAFLGSAPRLVGDAVLQLDQRQVIARREHRDTTRRLRSAFAIGSVMWPLTGLLDLLVANGDRALLAYLLTARAVGWPIIALGWVVLSSVRDPSPALVRLFDVLVFANASLLVCVMCLGFGGIESRYSTGLLIVILVRAAAIAEPWQRGIPAYAGVWSMFPAVMYGMAHFDARIAAQLTSRESLTIFGMQNFFISLGAAACVACGHAVWRARRDAYETRELGRYRLKARIGRGSMGRSGSRITQDCVRTWHSKCSRAATTAIGMRSSVSSARCRRSRGSRIPTRSASWISAAHRRGSGSTRWSCCRAAIWRSCCAAAARSMPRWPST